MNRTLLVPFCLFLTACDPSFDYGDTREDDFALADIDILMHAAPDNDSLPLEGKTDAVYPEKHSELVQLQSPVRSQGRRGVGSIFSTVALMEHLYIREGTITDPNFSEQYLQWSVKFEENSFPNSSGSNAYYNLRAINRHGIVDEITYPYETTQWGVDDDEECDGEDDQPTRCYTNGEPPRRYAMPANTVCPAGGG